MDRRVPGPNRQDRETLLRAYAAGQVSWSVLRERGIENYLDVLSGLGALDLRVPLAPPDEGRNQVARARARAWLHEALAATGRE